mgnify:CR=1 FL=1
MSKPISENSRFIALSPENGSEFVEGQKVIFEVKPNISFIKGKDSYISLDLENTSDNGVMAHPVSLAGCSGLIERMDIFAMESGQLLESLNNYNLWSAIENQYTTENSDELVYKEGCMTPFRAYICSSDADTKALVISDESIVAGANGSTRLSTIDSLGINKRFKHKFMIPIKSGIFNHYSDDEKLTPNLLFGGMRIEITLASNENVLSKVMAQDTAGVAHKAVDYASGIPCDDMAGVALIKVTAPANDPQSIGFSVGNVIHFNNAADTQNGSRTITVVDKTTTANHVTITVDAVITSATGVKIFHPPNSQTKYRVSNLELKVLEVIPPVDMMRSVIKESQIDFISYEVFTDNLPTTSLRHQVEFPSVSTKGKALFTHYISDTSTNDEFAPHYYAGESPTQSKLNSVQYFINNKNYPLKSYNPNSFNDRIIAYNEIVKAMRSIGLNVKKLGDSKMMADYSFTYLTARELARGKDFVYPLKDAEAQLRTQYSGTRTANHRLISFVFSVRSIMIDKNQLSVVY